MGLRWLVLVATAVSGCATTGPVKGPAPTAWRPRLSQLMPAEPDVRIWSNLEEMKRSNEDLHRELLQLMGEAPPWRVIEPCVADAASLDVAMRLGPRGMDGDVIVVVSGTRSVGRCPAAGWVRRGSVGGFERWEPEVSSPMRTMPAMALRSNDAVLVVTPGLIDVVLRGLKVGLSEGASVVSSGAVVVVESSLSEDTLPIGWRAMAPGLSALFRGAKRASLRVFARNGVEIVGDVDYATEAEAKESGRRLQQVRAEAEKLVPEPGREWLRSAQGERRGERVTVRVVVPLPPKSVE